jgi:hypothetical protein
MHGNLHEIGKYCYSIGMRAISITCRAVQVPFWPPARACARIAHRHFDSRLPEMLSVRRHDQGTLACLGRAR